MVKKSPKGLAVRLAVLLGLGVVISTGSMRGQNPSPRGYPITSINLKSPPVTVYSQVDHHPYVTWDTLAHFAYDAPDIEEEIDPSLRLKKKKYPVPDFIKQLDGASIAVVGFMIPLDTDDTEQKATSFILARTQASCCYGITPKMNEWMFVWMKKGKTAEAIMDLPVTVFGTLSVGEQKKRDTGWSLYRMVSDRVAVPEHSIW